MSYNPKCKNCGHELRHHMRMGTEGKVWICSALLSRVPEKFCQCKKFEEAEA